MDFVVKTRLSQQVAFMLLVRVYDLVDEVGEQLILHIGGVIAEEASIELLVVRCFALRLEKPQVELLLAEHDLDRLFVV